MPWEIRIGRRHGQHFLQPIVGTGQIGIDSGRIIALRKKTDRAAGDSGGIAVIGEADRRARFLHSDIQLKSVASPVRNVPRTVGATVRRIRKVDYAD